MYCILKSYESIGDYEALAADDKTKFSSDSYHLAKEQICLRDERNLVKPVHYIKSKN